MALKGLKVLIVDDDQIFANVVSEFLEELGCRTSTCNDAFQALIQTEGLRPNLVITDINMPHWGSGVDAYNKIRATRHLRGVPVIFMTSLTPEAAKAMMPQDDPLIRLVLKPVDFGMLPRLIEELCPRIGP